MVIKGYGYNFSKNIKPTPEHPQHPSECEHVGTTIQASSGDLRRSSPLLQSVGVIDVVCCNSAKSP